MEQIVAAVKQNAGPISVDGGRFSMGGQTETQGALINAGSAYRNSDRNGLMVLNWEWIN